MEKMTESKEDEVLLVPPMPDDVPKRLIPEKKKSKCTINWWDVLYFIILGTLLATFSWRTVSLQKRNDSLRRQLDNLIDLMQEYYSCFCKDADYPGPVCEDCVCGVELVESIPEGLTYNVTTKNKSTFDAWKELLASATTSLEFASSYWTLRGSDVYQDPSDWQGEQIYQLIRDAAIRRKIKIKIAVDLNHHMGYEDLDELAKIPGVEVKKVDFKHLIGNGILHTKLWLVDRTHFYVGSANFDWRSLTQVKEMGVMVKDCPVYAEDMGKIFDVYWMVGGEGKSLPATWPEELHTIINPVNQIEIKNSLNKGETIHSFLGSSPKKFNPRGRATDLVAITRAIEAAEKYIHVAVMDYFPVTIYTEKVIFDPTVDDALRKAAIERGVEVKLLLSNWTSTRSSMEGYLKSLTSVSDKKVSIQGRFFTVPADASQKKIPFARVNHNKYIVTDKEALIGTSNWSMDYFLYTGGIGFSFSSKASNGTSTITTHEKLANVFQRDWDSAYASKNV